VPLHRLCRRPPVSGLSARPVLERCLNLRCVNSGCPILDTTSAPVRRRDRSRGGESRRPASASPQRRARAMPRSAASPRFAFAVASVCVAWSTGGCRGPGIRCRRMWSRAGRGRADGRRSRSSGWFLSWWAARDYPAASSPGSVIS